MKSPYYKKLTVQHDRGTRIFSLQPHDHSWTVRQAIEKQIAIEDRGAWGRRKSAEFKVIAPHVPQKISQPVLKRLISIITA